MVARPSLHEFTHSMQDGKHVLENMVALVIVCFHSRMLERDSGYEEMIVSGLYARKGRTYH